MMIWALSSGYYLVSATVMAVYPPILAIGGIGQIVDYNL